MYTDREAREKRKHEGSREKSRKEGGDLTTGAGGRRRKEKGGWRSEGKETPFMPFKHKWYQVSLVVVVVEPLCVSLWLLVECEREVINSKCHSDKYVLQSEPSQGAKAAFN